MQAAHNRENDPDDAGNILGGTGKQTLILVNGKVINHRAISGTKHMNLVCIYGVKNIFFMIARVTPHRGLQFLII